MLVGLFEPERPPGRSTACRATRRSSSCRRTRTVGPFLGQAMARIPALAEIGIRKFFCGPESFTSDVHPLLGPAPELDGYFVAAGLNSLGILLGGGVGNMIAHWIVDGVPPVDVTGYAIDRTATHETRGGSAASAPWNSSASCSATPPGRPGGHGPPATCGGPSCTTGSSPRALTSALGGLGVRRVVRRARRGTLPTLPASSPRRRAASWPRSTGPSARAWASWT